MASSPVPSIIVLALGAGALGFSDALRVLLDIVGRRSPLTDIAICVFASKAAHAGGDDAQAPGAPPPTPTRTDRFAQVTLVVSLGVAFLVSACLLVDAGARGLLYLVVADVARKMKSPVLAVLATTAAAVLPCARPLLRVFRHEDHSHGAAAASRSTATGRFANMTQVASFTGASAFLLAVSGGLYIQRGPLVDMSVGVAAVVGTVLLARLTFTRKARNAADAGGRAAPASAADRQRVGGKLTRLAPYLVVVSFVALICCVVLTTDAPLESGPDGAK